MQERRLRLINQRGLHARAASKLVQCVAQFNVQLWLSFGGQKVEAQSILDVLTLAAPFGSELVFSATGPDAEAALVAIDNLVANKFDETE